MGRCLPGRSLVGGARRPRHPSVLLVCLYFLALAAGVQAAPPAAEAASSSAAGPVEPPAEEAPRDQLTPGEGSPASRAEAYADSNAPRLGDEAELDQVIELYMAGQYERCTSRLSTFLDSKGASPFRDAGVIERARLYYASCSILAGRREPARRALRSALEANPLMPAPDSLTFPPPVVSMFLEVRDEVEQLIAKREQEQLDEMQREAEAIEQKAVMRRARDAELLRLASEETVVVESSRVIASLPFGAGQFQSGKPALGWTFLISEALLLGTAVTSGLIYSDLLRVGSDAGSQVNAPLQASYDVMGVSTYALLSICALGIVEAHLTFKKERVVRVRPRALPADLRDSEAAGTEQPRAVRLAPGVMVSPSGAHFSLTGRF